jgi:predicted transcriptional regulator of viral defense system
MKTIEAYAQLKTLNQPILKTRDVATYLNISITTASKLLGRLAKHDHVIHLTSGLWGIPKQIDPLMLAEYLTAPFPSYISLQSALYYHGMITQIPPLIYAVSVARTKKHQTPLIDVSVHHVCASFFFGYETSKKYGIKMAIPEKALLDICYLSTAKTRIFHSLPELELPKNFSLKKSEEMIKKITSPNRQALVRKKFVKLLATIT